MTRPLRGVRKVQAPAPQRARAVERALEEFVLVMDVAGGREITATGRFYDDLAEAYETACKALGRASAR